MLEKTRHGKKKREANLPIATQLEMCVQHHNQHNRNGADSIQGWLITKFI